MNTKIFFTDLDGTLLNDEKKITKETFLTLEKWCQAGHKLVLCSGRALDSILHVFEALQLTFPGVYLVGCNGGEIYDCSKNKLLLRRTISYDDVEKVFSLAQKHQIHIQTYSETHIITKKEGKELYSFSILIFFLIKKNYILFSWSFRYYLRLHLDQVAKLV